MEQTARRISRPKFSPEFRRWWRMALLFLALVHAAIHLFLLVPRAWNRADAERDLVVYYAAAQRLRAGEPVYQFWPEYGAHMKPERFFYSPPFLLLTKPLDRLSFHDFARAWSLLMLAAFWAYAACLSVLATGRWNWKSWLIWGLFLGVWPGAYFAVALGQFEPVMWLLFGLALTTRFRAGWLSWAMLAKIHPLWSLLVVLERARRHGTVRGALVQLVAFAVPVVALSWWLVGSREWLNWWPAVAPVASQGTFDIDNVSLSFAILRVASALGFFEPHGALPPLARAFLSVCAVGAPLTTAWWARRQREEMQICLVACAAVLFAPLCWSLYLPLLLMPVALWWRERQREDKRQREGENKADENKADKLALS